MKVFSLNNAHPSLGVRFSIMGLLLISLVAVASPRFNRQDIGSLTKSMVGRGADGSPSMGDAPEYIRYVRFFRGEITRRELSTPFAYRPGAPFLASLLPVKDPMTALNLVNLAALALVLLFLHNLMRVLGYGFHESTVGDCVYIFSFPVFYYGTIGMVDPVWMACLVGSVFCLYRQQWIVLVGMVVLGAFVRETTVIVIPVTAVYILIVRPQKGVMKLMAVVLAYLFTTIVVRMAFADLDHYVWRPSLGCIRQNLRFRAITAMALSFGIPGFLTLLWFFQKVFRGRVLPLEVMAPMLVGILCVIGLSAFSFLAAYADGRFLWATCIFGMPFCLEVLVQSGVLRNRTK